MIPVIAIGTGIFFVSPRDFFFFLVLLLFFFVSPRLFPTSVSFLAFLSTRCSFSPSLLAVFLYFFLGLVCLSSRRIASRNWTVAGIRKLRISNGIEQGR